MRASNLGSFFVVFFTYNISCVSVVVTMATDCMETLVSENDLLLYVSSVTLRALIHH